MTQFRITPLKRPVDNHDWMNTPTTPEQQAASEAWQKKREATYQQFKGEWVPPPGYSAERDLEEMENVKSAAFTVWEERRKGRVVAASTPVWMDAFEFWLVDGANLDDFGILAKQPTAVSLTLPFVLKGGGGMQVTFETKKVLNTKSYGPEPRTWMASKLRLRVKTEHGVFTGRIERHCGERGWYVVSLPQRRRKKSPTGSRRPSTPSTSSTLADDYLTVMPVSDRCSICSRPLTDIISKTLGIGPDCAHRLKIPHSGRSPTRSLSNGRPSSPKRSTP